MRKLNQKQIAMKNTFKCREGKNYWCYLCEKAIENDEDADIDHIKPTSHYSNDEKQNSHGTSQNNGLGPIRELWIKWFPKGDWSHNNLIWTHKQCNLEKGDKDTTKFYINLIRKLSKK